MNAQDRLLTVKEAKDIILKGWCSPETRAEDIAIEPWEEAIRDAQDANTLESLREIIEFAARKPCLHAIGPLDRDVCGHCVTCQARAVLAEMNKTKDKEGTKA